MSLPSKKTKLVAAWILCLIFGCQPADQNLAKSNKEIVKRANEIVGAGDYDGMDQVIAANYVRHSQATPNLTINSLEAFKEFIRNDREVFPDQSLDFKMLVAEKDLVAFYATYTGTQTGQMGPFPPSNKSVTLEFAGVHRVENGKIAETWITWDNLTILTQLGHFPPATASNVE